MDNVDLLTNRLCIYYNRDKHLEKLQYFLIYHQLHD